MKAWRVVSILDVLSEYKFNINIGGIPMDKLIGTNTSCYVGCSSAGMYLAGTTGLMLSFDSFHISSLTYTLLEL